MQSGQGRERLSFVPQALLSSVSGTVLLPCFLTKVSMPQILQILAITVKTGTSKKTGAAFSIPEAHCILQDETGKATGVGVYVVPKDLEATIKPGYYTPAYEMRSSTFGDGAGQIVAAISGLTELPPGAIQKLSRQPAPAGT
jgi:hypothetical protein